MDNPHVPYQPYRSKRHSRNLSTLHFVPNVSPPPPSRGVSVVSDNGPVVHPQTHSHHHEDVDTEKFPAEFADVIPVKSDIRPPSRVIQQIPEVVIASPPTPEISSSDSSPGRLDVPVVDRLASLADPGLGSDVPVPTATSVLNGKSRESELSPDSSAPSSPVKDDKPNMSPRKSSTFRHIPLRPSTKSGLPSSPLRPPGSHSRLSSLSSVRQLDKPVPHEPTPAPTAMHSRVQSITSESTVIEAPVPVPALTSQRSTDSSKQALHFSDQLVPPHRGSSLSRSSRHHPKSSSTSPAASITPISSPTPSTRSLPVQYVDTRPMHRSLAPYLPGFQPNGLYRPRTDEFTEARKVHLDNGMIERAKLERRLEKLINLHFPADGAGSISPKRSNSNQRSSSFFELDLSSIKDIDAADLWKGMFQAQASQGAQGDKRAAEQRITPWQDDALVSKCPLCEASFHSLTNRKHHCRLCGKIICSLPIKRPQRPEPCSLLFIVEPKTRLIEEVGEGVDYGVRKRRALDPQAKGKGSEDVLPEDEKFLKGVRICRDCRPVLLRQQHQQEIAHTPIFATLYNAFIRLEQEIEQALPQFQELIVSLKQEEQPAKEASAARKRLLDAFSQYDALSKRIRKLPCRAGSSQDRVQMAVLTRANLFLQNNMFPLQSLPTPAKSSPKKSAGDSQGPTIDPDSAMAHALQPLLEQEALLETFIEEAMAHRKFEDAKTLKANLQEIRVEIDKMLANAGDDMGKTAIAG